MNPCELNAAIAALTNHLYTTLSPRDFNQLTIFLSELSKDMFSMALLREVCERRRWRDGDAGDAGDIIEEAVEVAGAEELT